MFLRHTSLHACSYNALPPIAPSSTCALTDGGSSSLEDDDTPRVLLLPSALTNVDLRSSALASVLRLTRSCMTDMTALTNMYMPSPMSNEMVRNTCRVEWDEVVWRFQWHKKRNNLSQLPFLELLMTKPTPTAQSQEFGAFVNMDVYTCRLGRGQGNCVACARLNCNTYGYSIHAFDGCRPKDDCSAIVACISLAGSEGIA